LQYQRITKGFQASNEARVDSFIWDRRAMPSTQQVPRRIKCF
jgi:hypothetical protein